MIYGSQTTVAFIHHPRYRHVYEIFRSSHEIYSSRTPWGCKDSYRDRIHDWILTWIIFASERPRWEAIFARVNITSAFLALIQSSLSGEMNAQICRMVHHLEGGMEGRLSESLRNTHWLPDCSCDTATSDIKLCCPLLRRRLTHQQNSTAWWWLLGILIASKGIAALILIQFDPSTFGSLPLAQLIGVGVYQNARTSW